VGAAAPRVPGVARRGSAVRAGAGGHGRRCASRGNRRGLRRNWGRGSGLRPHPRVAGHPARGRRPAGTWAVCCDARMSGLWAEAAMVFCALHTIPSIISLPPAGPPDRAQGLHIRLDLSTGERYAKLIDGVEDSSSSSAAVSTSFKVNRTDGAVVATEPPPEPLEPGEASRRTKEKVLSDLPPAELQAMGVDFAKVCVCLRAFMYVCVMCMVERTIAGCVMSTWLWMVGMPDMEGGTMLNCELVHDRMGVCVCAPRRPRRSCRRRTTGRWWRPRGSSGRPSSSRSTSRCSSRPRSSARSSPPSQSPPTPRTTVRARVYAWVHGCSYPCVYVCT
jgi:hypothetical protein